MRRSLVPTPPLGPHLRYLFGGRLPRHRDWVSIDLTAPGWRWRSLGRVLLQCLPGAVIFALLPGPVWLHVVLPLFVLVCGGFIGTAYADELRDRRLAAHGLTRPAGR